MNIKKLPLIKGWVSRVLLYYGIAILFSNLFRFKVISIPQTLMSGENANLLYALLEGSGIFGGAVLALYLLRQKKPSRNSLFGTSKVFSVICFLLPVAVTIGISLLSGIRTEAVTYLVMLCLVSLFYCLMEEMGWRYYLHEELAQVPEKFLYLIIGSVWYFWHLTFIQNTDVKVNVIFWAALVVGSWGLGQILKATRSILACASMHFIVGMMMTNQLMKNYDYGIPKWQLVCIIIFAYIVLLKIWERSHPVKSTLKGTYNAE